MFKDVGREKTKTEDLCAGVRVMECGVQIIS